MTTPAPSPGNRKNESLRHLPPSARNAFERFQTGGDPAALAPVINAILEDFIPKPPVQPFAEMPGGTRLIDDLGYDSLAITELVFFTEELFGISISNEEIIKVRTLDDLRAFVGSKVEGIRSH